MKQKYVVYSPDVETLIKDEQKVIGEIIQPMTGSYFPMPDAKAFLMRHKMIEHAQ